MSLFATNANHDVMDTIEYHMMLNCYQFHDKIHWFATVATNASKENLQSKYWSSSHLSITNMMSN